MYVNYNKLTDWTKEKILFALATDDAWVERALVVLFERQTEIERDPRVEETIDKNTIGFQRADVKYFTRFARKIIAGKHLTSRELAFTRRPWRRGRTPIPTIAKYRGQLLQLIEARARQKKLAAQ